MTGGGSKSIVKRRNGTGERDELRCRWYLRSCDPDTLHEGCVLLELARDWPRLRPRVNDRLLARAGLTVPVVDTVCGTRWLLGECLASSALSADEVIEASLALANEADRETPAHQRLTSEARAFFLGEWEARLVRALSNTRG